MENGSVIPTIYKKYVKHNGKSGQNEPKFKIQYKDDLDILNMQQFGQIGFATIQNEKKQKLSKRSFKAITVGIQKHHANDSYYMYNPETKNIIVSRDISKNRYKVLHA